MSDSFNAQQPMNAQEGAGLERPLESTGGKASGRRGCPSAIADNGAKMTSRYRKEIILRLGLIAVFIASAPGTLAAQEQKPDSIDSQITKISGILTEQAQAETSTFSPAAAKNSAPNFEWKNVRMIARSTTPVSPADSSEAAPSTSGASSSGYNSGSDGWTFQLTPYLWMAGLNGTVAVRNQTANVSASFSDILSNLNIGFMSTFEARKGRWGLVTDLQYLNLTAKNTVAMTSIGTKFTSKLFVLDPEAFYRILNRPQGSIDAMVGFRFWHSGNSLRITPNLLPPVTTNQDKNWVDPVLGARFKVNLGRGFYGVFKGDAGGFGAGSDLTYQIFAGFGKAIKERYALIIGYRRLYVDFGAGGYLQNFSISGLALGFGIKF